MAQGMDRVVVPARQCCVTLSLAKKVAKNTSNRLCRRRLRQNANVSPIDERDRRIDDYPIPLLDAAIHFDPRAEIALVGSQVLKYVA
jgi:hypothetical protein